MYIESGKPEHVEKTGIFPLNLETVLEKCKSPLMLFYNTNLINSHVFPSYFIIFILFGQLTNISFTGTHFEQV